MSQMIVKGLAGERFKLNVVQFRSSMSASINSVQTRTMMQHFPIRAGQPDIEFTVQFASIDDKHRFQNFVRRHQRNVHSGNYSDLSRAKRSAVTLMWPERNINNWTGFITNMPVREARFDYAPKVTFGVALMDSMLSQWTQDMSRGSDFWSVAGPQIPAYIATVTEAVLQPPTPPSGGVNTSVVQEVVQTARSVAESIIGLVTGR